MTQKHINFEVAANPSMLVDLLNAMDMEIDALRTEIGHLNTDLAAIDTWTTEVDGDLDKINDYTSLINEPNGVHSGSTYTLAEAAAVNYTGAGIVYYRINGEEYWCDLDTTVTFTGTDELTDGKFRAYRMEIDAVGTVTLTGPGNKDLTSAEQALLTLCSTARTADTATLGYVVLGASGAAFTPGTTDTNAGAHTNVFYYTKGFERRMSGLTASTSLDLVVGTTPEQYQIGTLDYKVMGQNVAQDVADVDCTFVDADTITGGAGKFGGVLVVTNVAQNLTVAVAADGLAESVSDMTYTSIAAVQVDLLKCLNALPEVFAPVGYIIVEGAGDDPFTFTTSALDDVDGKPTFVTFDVGTWDRVADEAQTLSQHGLNVPTIPDSVTATMPANTVVTVTERVTRQT